MANRKSKPQARVGAPTSRIRSTPIGDYGFLSDGEVSALVAPNGAMEWMCVPRFDSPSVFGSLLDREAGYFRLGPFGINHPSAGLRARNERPLHDMENARPPTRCCCTLR